MANAPMASPPVLHQLRADGVTIVERDGTISSVGGEAVTVDRIVPENDQTEVRLSRAPAGPVLLYVNGLLQDPADYAVASDVLTWLGHGFALASSDRLAAVYE